MYHHTQTHMLYIHKNTQKQSKESEWSGFRQKKNLKISVHNFIKSFELNCFQTES